jgi:hypothetical protein
MAINRREFLKTAVGAATVGSLPATLSCRDGKTESNKLTPEEQLAMATGLFMHEVNKAPTRDDLKKLIDKFRPIFERYEKEVSPKKKQPENLAVRVSSPGDSSRGENAIRAEESFFIDAFSLSDLRLLTPSMKGIVINADTQAGEWIAPTNSLNIIGWVLDHYDQKAQRIGTRGLFRDAEGR